MAEKGGHWVKSAGGGMSFRQAGGGYSDANVRIRAGEIFTVTQKPSKREPSALTSQQELVGRAAKAAGIGGPSASIESLARTYGPIFPSVASLKKAAKGRGPYAFGLYGNIAKHALDILGQG